MAGEHRKNTVSKICTYTICTLIMCPHTSAISEALVIPGVERGVWNYYGRGGEGRGGEGRGGGEREACKTFSQRTRARATRDCTTLFAI